MSELQVVVVLHLVAEIGVGVDVGQELSDRPHLAFELIAAASFQPSETSPPHSHHPQK
jgi:hypothetical protein